MEVGNGLIEILHHGKVLNRAACFSMLKFTRMCRNHGQCHGSDWAWCPWFPVPAAPGAGAAQLGSDYRSRAGNSAEAGSAARLMPG